MKICILTPTFPFGGTTVRGGTNTYAETFAKALARSGATVHVVAYDMPQPSALPANLPYTFHFPSLPWIPYFSAFFPGVAQSRALAKFLAALDQREHFDAIEGGNYEGWMLHTARRFGARFWMRCYTSLGHCIKQRGLPLTWRRRFAVWLDGRAVRCTQNVVTHSLCHAGETGREYGIDPQRIRVAPLGVDFSEPPSFPAGPARTVAYVGILDKRKAVDVLLKAIPGVLKSMPEARFEIIGYDGGDSPGSSWKEWFAATYPAEAASGRVTFHGFVPDDAMRELWKKIDVVCVPSRYESFGLVVVEGFARGKVVVATRGGALPEVAGDGAILVEPGDAESLAEGLVKVLRDESLAGALARRGHAIFLEKYRLDRFAEHVVRLYSCQAA